MFMAPVKINAATLHRNTSISQQRAAENLPISPQPRHPPRSASIDLKRLLLCCEDVLTLI
jgi:hypothetical protein